VKEHNTKLIRIYAGEFLAAQKARIIAEIEALKSDIGYSEQIVFHADKERRKAEKNCFNVAEVQCYSNSILKAAICLSRLIKKEHPVYLHAHGIKSVFIAIIAKWLILTNRPFLIYEVHGAAAFESLYRHQKSLSRWLRFLIVYFLESLAVLLSNRILLVSKKIVHYYPLLKFKRCVVIPRFISEEHIDWNKQEISETFKLFKSFSDNAKKHHKKIIVYSGGAAVWQCVEEMLKIMGFLTEKCRFCMAIFTYEQDKFKKKALKYAQDPDVFFSGNLKDAELISALSLCDIGILLRKNLVLNQVASPTKLYEYLYAGLALITTDSVVEALPIIQQTKAGIILKDLFLTNIEKTCSFVESNLNSILNTRKNLLAYRHELTWAKGKILLQKLYDKVNI